MTDKFFDYIRLALKLNFNKDIKSAAPTELYNSIGKAFNAVCSDFPQNEDEKRACYFSAEFLIGKLTKSNLFNLGLLEKTEKMLAEQGRSLNEFEDFDDLALGNGGLGRLAACFLDSAASIDIPLDGYGIRYRYGYFKQTIVNDEQKEEADDWLKFTDAFGLRKDDDAVEVTFRNEKIRAVPYIYYIPGYENNRMNKLCLFQAEALNDFEYEIFDRGDWQDAFSPMVSAMTISANLYPNDNSEAGKILRLKQQYFFTSAALQLILKRHIDSGKSIHALPDSVVIQLNDTHPTIAIPELIRLIINLGESFDTAFEIAGKVFAYTNHTVLAEALEKWDEKLFLKVVPDVYEIIKMIDERLRFELKMLNLKPDEYLIIKDGAVHMANLACYVAFSVNGVAKIHTDIIKSDTLNQWYQLYPKKFNNKTNGVTQRRWLALSDPELTALISKLISESCVDNFNDIKKLEAYADDEAVLDKLFEIRYENKKRLCNYIYKTEHIRLDPDFLFCTQVKRLHEYKRQLMNILSVIHIYLSLKSGELKKINPTVFIIGAKAAPGYKIAKRIIEFINVVARKINADEQTNSMLRVVFVSNYNVSCAEKIIPATDISEQISLAGKEASGTSNMKFMMNGAVTLGTYDGANIEIVQKAGEENNYIFGLRENEVREQSKVYDPLSEYESNKYVKRAVDTLTNATFLDENEEPFNDIFNSLIDEDRYMVLKDLPDYIEKKLKAISDYSDRRSFFRKALINIANSSDFSSDRTVREYADDIWFKG
ncbi:MAG: glycogen/starch/alpha-glucan phosphorylase [Oscillospiraceae bacterium]|nr:glycogen/starch/alpha-glucan phosphorylase [Oscillospiraceae bacterium]